MQGQRYKLFCAYNSSIRTYVLYGYYFTLCYRGMENFIRNKYERKTYVSKDKSKEQVATSTKVRIVNIIGKF